MEWWSIILVVIFLPASSAQGGTEIDKDLGYYVVTLNYYYQAIDSFQGEMSSFTPDTRIYNYYFYYDDIVDLALDPRNKRAFAYDGERSQLLEFSGIDITLDYFMSYSPIQYGVSYVQYAKLAYDWLTENLYWTDTRYNWIAMMSTKKNAPTSQIIVHHEGLLIPSALGIDPIAGYLFFAEIGQSTNYIARSHLDGTNKTHIRTFGYRIIDITADVYSQKIYWVDDKENAIYVSDYEGSTKVLFRKQEFIGFMGSVDVSKTLVCTTESYYGYVVCAKKSDGMQTWNFNYVFDSPWVGRVSDKENQLMVNHECESMDCPYTCVNKPDGAVCLCQDGHYLTQNNTCEPSHLLYPRGILIAKDKEFCMLDKGVFADSTGYYDAGMCFFTWNRTINHMAVNSHNVTIFFADNMGIFKHDVIQNITIPVTYATDISGLAFDWNEQYIYWTEKSVGKINEMVTAVGATPGFRNVYSGLNNPSNLTINPHNDTLYWISMIDDRYTIEGGTFDGSSRWAIVDESELENPTGLFYDIGTDRLYWINAGVIRKVKGDGTDMDTLQSVPFDSFLVAYKDYVLTARRTGILQISYVYSSSSSMKTINPSSSENVTAMAVFDDTTQRFEIGVCEKDNGGCEHMCVPEANNQRKCACNNGYVKNATNPNGCTSHPMTSNFILVCDFSHEQILQVDINNASHVVAIDLKGSNDPLAAVYIQSQQKIVWSDYVTNNVMAADLDGKNREMIFNPGNYDVYSLAVDSTSGYIYYTADPTIFDQEPFIGVIDPNNRKHLKIEDIAYGYIWSVALYPAEGIMVFVDPGYYGYYGGYIGKAGMDGSFQGYLVSSGLRLPNSVAIAFPSNGREAMVYWSDLADETIYSIPLNPGDQSVSTVYHDEGSKMAHIGISDNFIYYTASNTQIITKLNFQGQKVAWMDENHEIGRLESIDIYTDTGLEVHGPCSRNNGRCSTFCLPTSRTERVCACEDGVSIGSDGRTCNNVQKCDDNVQNGNLNATCTGYVNTTCSYSCYSGYQPVNNMPLKCSENGGTLSWNLALDTICVPIPPPTTTTTTPAPTTTTTARIAVIPAAQTSTQEGITNATFVAVILAIVILFLIVLFGVVYYMRRQKSQNMFGHAKFVNSGNVSVDASVPESNYSTLDRPQARYARGDGMENPLYETKNKPPQQPTYDNTVSQQDQINLDMPIKF